MGHVHVHPQDAQQINKEQNNNETNLNPIINTSMHDEQVKIQSQLIESIHLPCFQIKESPFKYFNIITKELNKNTISISSYSEKINGSFQNKVQSSVTPPSNSNNQSNLYVSSALCVFYTPKLLHMILDLLPAEDCLNVGILNQRFSTQVFLYRLFHCPNNWQFTLNQIRIKMEKENLKNSYLKMLCLGQLQESQHSLDLERLQSFFVDGQQINEQIVRVDKIMKALIASGIQYFQGLNSIIIVLLHLFNNHSSYWLTHLLLHKTQNIQNTPQNYLKTIRRIQNKLKQKCPSIIQKLQAFDLDVEYFVMSWVMSLFANDIQRIVVLQIWDLIYSFGIQALLWFIVSLFVVLEKDILEKTNGDQINSLLKKGLKRLIKGQLAKQILQNTRVLLAEQIYGEGCAQIVQPWNYLPQIIKLSIPKYFSYSNSQNLVVKQIDQIQQKRQQQQQSFLNELKNQQNCSRQQSQKNNKNNNNNQEQQAIALTKTINQAGRKNTPTCTPQKQQSKQTHKYKQISLLQSPLQNSNTRLLLLQSTQKQKYSPHVYGYITNINLFLPDRIDIEQQTSYQTLNSDTNLTNKIITQNSNNSNKNNRKYYTEQQYQYQYQNKNQQQQQQQQQQISINKNKNQYTNTNTNNIQIH